MRTMTRCPKTPLGLTTLLLAGLATPALAGPAELEIGAPAARWLERDGGWWPEQIHLTGDFDGDGRPDIGRHFRDGNNQGYFDLLGNVGDGFVAGPWSIPGLVIAGDQYTGAGDIDGDGRTDSVWAWNHDGQTTISVFTAGDGHLEGSTLVLQDGDWPADGHMLVDDFDGDGRDDVALSYAIAEVNHLRVYPSSAGFVGQLWMVQGGYWLDTMDFTTGDFDGDGRADIARVYAEDGQISVNHLISTGAAFLPRMATHRFGHLPQQMSVRGGDFDGDGLDDVLLLGITQSYFSRFGEAVVLRSDGLGGHEWHRLTTFDLSNHAWDPFGWIGDIDGHWVTADFDADGRAELAQVHGCSGLACVEVYGAPQPAFESGPDAVRWMTTNGGFGADQTHVAGDFDGNGTPDMARVFPENGMTSADALLNDRGGLLGHRWMTMLGGHWPGMTFAAGDVDGDGRDDIVRFFEDGGNEAGGGWLSLDVLRSHGNGFTNQRWATRAGPRLPGDHGLVGDMDGDGLADVVRVGSRIEVTEIHGVNGSYALQTTIGEVDIYANRGDHFAAAVRHFEAAADWHATDRFVLGDFDGDGRDELAHIGDDLGAVSIDVLVCADVCHFERRASGRFIFGAEHTFLAEDFDGDGRDDIVQIFGTPDARAGLRVFESRGDRFLARQMLYAGADFSADMHPVAADFDLDGRAEVAVAYRDTGSAATHVDIYGGSPDVNAALVAEVGTSRRFAPAEVAANLAAQGLTLVQGATIGPNECAVIYPNADDVHGGDGRDMGLLNCQAVEYLDMGYFGRYVVGVDMLSTPIHGGCDIAVTGGQCEFGTVAHSLNVNSPWGGQTTLQVSGPAAGACGSVSRESVCASVGVNLWEASFTVTDSSGNGGGLGVYSGVGAGASTNYDSGVLSGSISLAVGGGFELRYSVNLEQVYGYGEVAFRYVEYGVDASIEAGGVVVDYVVGGLGDAAGAVLGAIDDAVGVIGGLF